jgi:hypothetical protein
MARDGHLCSNGKSSIVEERILLFFLVPSIVGEQIHLFFFVPSIVGEQIHSIFFVSSIVEELNIRFFLSI